MSTDEPHDGQLETEIAALAVSPASAACVWLGQGGYLFKSPRGTTVMVDAYLSDYAAEFWGVTRAIPPVVDPARIKPDVFLVTHWHEDHLDAPTVRHYAQQPDVVSQRFVGVGFRCHAGWVALLYPAYRFVELKPSSSPAAGAIGNTQ